MIDQKIAFDLWANRLILDSLQQITDQETKKEATRFFGHLLNAQVIWHNRINNIQEKVVVWDDFTLSDCLQLYADSARIWQGIAEKIEEEFEYHDSKGNAYTNRVEDIFDHVIIHGQHHRAQISMLIRATGITPPPTDYIYFLRTL